MNNPYWLTAMLGKHIKTADKAEELLKLPDGVLTDFEIECVKNTINALREAENGSNSAQIWLINNGIDDIKVNDSEYLSDIMMKFNEQQESA